MAIQKFYKIIEPRTEPFTTIDNQDIGSAATYGSNNWYHRAVQGSASRITKYREYDAMDDDVDVARALDLIAEEMLGNAPKSQLPLEIKITAEQEELVSSAVVVTLKAALKTWCTIQDWNKRLFNIVRQTIKYGDAFFIRPTKKYEKLLFVSAKNVLDAIVPENDITNVLAWNMKTDFRNAHGGSGIGSTGYSGSSEVSHTDIFKASEIVRFTLNNDMSEEAPFGESILRAVYRTFKQKQMLEDAILIYRIQRAPERRVFYIDTGNMPANRIAQHLEQVKNEFRQKKVPSHYQGKNTVESIYDPQQINADFWFSRRKDGSGSTVEQLDSGMNLGEITDLDWFYKKMWRGLRIPQSYMDSSTEGGAIATDGKVGIAYIQEIVFILYVQRLQKQIEDTLDKEFKRFLYDQNIKVDNTIFVVSLPEPSNYSKSRQQQMDAESLNNYGSIKDDPNMSPRFAMSKYLQLSAEEIILNQRLKLEEMGINPDKATKADLIRIYNPDHAEAGGFDGGLGGGAGSGDMNAPIEGDDTTMDENLNDDTSVENGDDANQNKSSPNEFKPPNSGGNANKPK